MPARSPRRAQWVHSAGVVEAARDQGGHSLRGRAIEMRRDGRAGAPRSAADRRRAARAARERGAVFAKGAAIDVQRRSSRRRIDVSRARSRDPAFRGRRRAHRSSASIAAHDDRQCDSGPAWDWRSPGLLAAEGARIWAENTDRAARGFRSCCRRGSRPARRWPESDGRANSPRRRRTCRFGGRWRRCCARGLRGR